MLLLGSLLPVLALAASVEAAALRIPLSKRQDPSRVTGPLNDPTVVDWNAIKEEARRADRKFGNGKAERLMKLGGGRVGAALGQAKKQVEGVLDEMGAPVVDIPSLLGKRQASTSTTAVRSPRAPTRSPRRTTTAALVASSTSQTPTAAATTTQAATTPATSTAAATSAAVTSSTVAPPPVVAKTQGGVALTNFNNGQLWAGFVTVGTPPARFLIDFDTGSSDMWIPSINSSSTHAKYDDKKSSTAVFVPNQSFSITYGDGSTTSGNVWTDTVSIAGLNSTTQTFSATTGNSASIERLAFDGLLGMGYQSISNLGAMPWVQNIFSQGKIAAAVFSFKLAAASAASELYIGGINNALIVAGSTSWFPVTFRSYWVIDGAINGGITGQTQTNSIVAFNAIIDTGTTLIIAPTADANAFYAKIGGTAINDGSGFYTFPCAQRNTVSFSYGGTTQQFPVISPGFNLGQTQSGSGICVGAIVASTSSLPAWIIGDIFLGNVYSTFDLTNNRVGFSKLA